MAKVSGLTLFTDVILTVPGVQRAVERKAGDICRDANQTSAKIGITWRRTSDLTVLIGPRGAPAKPNRPGESSFSTVVTDRQRRSVAHQC